MCHRSIRPEAVCRAPHKVCGPAGTHSDHRQHCVLPSHQQERGCWEHGCSSGMFVCIIFITPWFCRFFFFLAVFLMIVHLRDIFTSCFLYVREMVWRRLRSHRSSPSRACTGISLLSTSLNCLTAYLSHMASLKTLTLTMSKGQHSGEQVSLLYIFIQTLKQLADTVGLFSEIVSHSPHIYLYSISFLAYINKK